MRRPPRDKRERWKSEKKHDRGEFFATCPQTGKKSYDTSWKCSEQMQRIADLTGDINTMNVYQCRHCGKFHFGHMRREY